MKKTAVLSIITLIIMSSCSNKSSEFLGKWKSDNFETNIVKCKKDQIPVKIFTELLIKGVSKHEGSIISEDKINDYYSISIGQRGDISYGIGYLDSRGEYNIFIQDAYFSINTSGNLIVTERNGEITTFLKMNE